VKILQGPPDATTTAPISFTSGKSVKGRWIGRSFLPELEPSLPGKVSMEEASITAARMESTVRAAIDEVAAVTVRPRVRR
jgi:divalent metal cation (Fe/Co/Zn/Cd) transporter